MDSNISISQEEYELYLLNSYKPLILFMVNDSPGLKYGVGTYRNSIIRVFGDGQQMDVIEVVLKVFSPSREPKFELRGNIPRYQFPSNNARDDDYYRFVCFFLISRIARSRRIIVHCNYACQLPLALHFKELASARIVYTQHYMDWCIRFGPDYMEAAPHIAQDTQALSKFNSEKEIMALADTVIVSTNKACQTLTSIYGIERAKIKVIPLSIIKNQEFRHKEYLREKYHLSNERVILYVGRLDENKCIGDIIKAVSGVKDRNIRLWIVGDGHFTEYLSMIDEDNWHRITFWGFRGRKTISEMYNIAEIGLIPSAYEEFGYVALEMMAHGLPVIARRTSGLIEITENGELGDLFDFRSGPNDIRTHIAYRLRNPYSEDQRLALMEHVARRYGFSRFKNETREVFESLIVREMEANQSTYPPIDPLLKSIADREIMMLPFVGDPSLSEGLTGMAVFFSLLSVESEIKAYKNVAEHLLNRMCEGIPEDISLDFHRGITGIGWGLFFLKELGVIESDIGFILEEVDRLILDRLHMYRTVGMDDDALTGIRRYVRTRLCHSSVAGHQTEDQVLKGLRKEMDEIGMEHWNEEIDNEDNWKECLRYWRKSISTDNPTWKTGLLIIEGQSKTTENLIQTMSQGDYPHKHSL